MSNDLDIQSALRALRHAPSQFSTEALRALQEQISTELAGRACTYKNNQKPVDRNLWRAVRTSEGCPGEESEVSPRVYAAQIIFASYKQDIGPDGQDRGMCFQGSFGFKQGDSPRVMRSKINWTLNPQRWTGFVCAALPGWHEKQDQTIRASDLYGRQLAVVVSYGKGRFAAGGETPRLVISEFQPLASCE